MKIYCDMDMVLVRQTGQDGFATMPWMADGKVLWAFIRPYEPTLLSQLPDQRFDRCEPQKREWARIELGASVPVIVVKKSFGKAGYAAPGAILIDDAEHTHGKAWAAAGGVFIHHISAARSIDLLRKVLP